MTAAIYKLRLTGTDAAWGAEYPTQFTVHNDRDEHVLTIDYAYTNETDLDAEVTVRAYMPPERANSDLRWGTPNVNSLQAHAMLAWEATSSEWSDMGCWPLDKREFIEFTVA